MEIQNQQNRQMSAAEFGFRFTSKSEIYKFLTVDAGAYLPPSC